ncbi:Transmembrane proteins 14C [Prunus dulcis]|uniref:Transmembrane proteins 14C n=1 Tax=Prunus dulcis TaxID=3755 RepID=A0A4Y1RH23_PRUDU|nr:Transmembrane proteins 14C [Prunus dulcis]
MEGCLYERNPRTPSFKSPAFSNSHPYRCNYNAGDGKLAMNNASFKTKPKTQRRRFLCTSQLAEYAQLLLQSTGSCSSAVVYLLMRDQEARAFIYDAFGNIAFPVSNHNGYTGITLDKQQKLQISVKEQPPERGPYAYYLMQTPETKAIGDALGFGSAFLFASVYD